MLLSLSTWEEIQAYLTRSRGIIIPVGSTEQHGPMGFMGTDAICPETIAHRVADQEDILVAPTLSYGMSQHHMAFPGSVTLQPATLIAVTEDIVRSLTLHGFTHILFFNGHGGNVGPLTTAFSQIYTGYSLKGEACPIHLKLANWYDGKQAAALIEAEFKESEGSHATPGELSLSFFACPGSEKSAELNPALAPDGHFRDAADFRRCFPDGRMGSNSGLARQRIGARLCDAGTADLIDTYTRFTTPQGTKT